MDNPISEPSAAPLNAFEAADAFSSLMGSDDLSENETQQPESPEAAAERLAKLELSGEDDSDTEEGDKDTAPDDITVEIDGKTVKLTKEQIAENYKNGLRQADYTRKTMEAAESRKTADAESARARQERDSYAQKLHAFALTTNAAMQEHAALLTTELAQSDPVEYTLQKHLYDQRQAQLQQANQELYAITEQQKQEHSQARQTYEAEQRDLLFKKLPEWSDEGKRKKEQAAILDVAQAIGYTADELATLADHRFVLLARKAMQYDALIERAKTASKKVAALPVKAERAGSAEVSKPDGRTAAMKRLAATGSINDAANAFSQFV